MKTARAHQIWKSTAIVLLIGLSFLLLAVHHHNDLQSENQCPICAHSQSFSLPNDVAQAPVAVFGSVAIQPLFEESFAGFFIAGHFLKRAPPALV